MDFQVIFFLELDCMRDNGVWSVFRVFGDLDYSHRANMMLAVAR
jgi:hypothetical protein